MNDISMDKINLDDSTAREVEKGEIVKGKVVQITKEGVYLDIGAKVEGRIPIQEFDFTPKIGEEIDVLIVENNEMTGEIELSKNQADFVKAWKNVEDIYNGFGYISGVITKKMDNGYEVDIGVPAFLPFSHMKMVENLKDIQDKSLMFKILKINKKNKSVVVSRREYINEINSKKKEEIFSTVKEGDILEGIVKNIQDFGVFIDLGGVDGLIPRKELSWQRFKDPENVVSINQKIKGSVIMIDKEKERIVLSYKNTQPNPWSDIDKHYQIDMIAKGKVAEIKEFGVFVELENGIDGFISKDNLSWAQHTKSPKEVVSIGDEVEVKILDIDKLEKKIKLGLKQIMPNPWNKVEEKYNVGQKVNVRVKRITGSGAYVEIEGENELEGFIELKDVSWVKKIKHGKNAFKRGQKLEAVILDIDRYQSVIKFGLKQLEVNPWNILKEKMEKKESVECVVKRVNNGGAAVVVNDVLDGFIPVSHFSERRIEKPKSYLKRGQKLRCAVVEVDELRKVAILSLREYNKIKSQEEMKKYLKHDKTEKMRLGDMIKLGKTE